ncbi:MAG TPA: PhoH family protein [Clostridiales bacterium]|nr:PhoH family protein [Clostridiales bacterium]
MEFTNRDETVLSLGNEMQTAAVLGQRDENLLRIEKEVNAEILVRGDEVRIKGNEAQREKALRIFNHLKTLAAADVEINANVLNYAVAAAEEKQDNVASSLTGNIYVTPKGKQIKARTLGQKRYVEALGNHDIVFAIGPAGTGKTYLAVAEAVVALKKKEVRRIILTRPAVEAGEKLGFLPGDLQDKVDPYLRPLYDSLYDILGSDTAVKLMEKSIIEVAPLAYMRGRTLDDAFIILDEAQNTTVPQMKMFLTRTGFGSRAVITGDITQVDLAPGEKSGLIHAGKILQNVEGIGFAFMSHLDVVRHPLVQKIIDAYERAEHHEK